MKTTRIVTSVLLSLVLAPMALTASAQPTQPKDEGDIIAAQVGVTRDGISQVVRGMEKVSAQAQLDSSSHPDFMAKAKAMNQDVDKAMTAFEESLRVKILHPAQLYVDRLRAILNSKAYTEDQRTALYGAELRLAKQAFEGLSKEYQRLLWDLYFVGLPRLDQQFVDYDTEKEGCNANRDGFVFTFSRCLKKLTIQTKILSLDPRIGLEPLATPTYVWGASQLGYEERKNFSETEARAKISSFVYNSYVSTEITNGLFNRYLNRGCYSTACSALFSGQVVSYLKLVRTSLDKPISFKIAGYESIELGNTGADVDRMAKFMALPEVLPPLPFDISPSDYRAALVNGVSQVLTNRDLEIKEGCPNSVTRPLELLCFSEAGCLNDSERSIIASRIEGADLRRGEKPARMACLGPRAN